MAKNTVVIKKYENRRLYDTTNSRYVNLEEVAQLLQQGNEVQVIDAASGEDITRLILTQIIVEDAKTADSTFPLDLLRQMVVATGRASQENALNYMKTMLDLYQNTYRAMPNPFDLLQGYRSNPERPGDGNHVEQPASSQKAEAEAAKPQKTTEAQELKKRVAELEKLVSTLVADQPAPTKQKSPKRKK